MWTEQFEIIWEIAQKKFARKGISLSQNKLEIYLDVSKGKVQHWKRGQRPAADDLQKIAEMLGFSPEWLLMGTGSPIIETACSLENRRWDDTVREALELHFGKEYGSPEKNTRAIAVGLEISQTDLEAELARPRPSWQFLQMLEKSGIHVAFLLIDQKPARIPRPHIERVIQTTGLNWSTLAGIIGIDNREMEKHLKEAEGTDQTMPQKWFKALEKNLKLEPGWLWLLCQGSTPDIREKTKADEQGHVPADSLSATTWQLEQSLRKVDMDVLQIIVQMRSALAARAQQIQKQREDEVGYKVRETPTQQHAVQEQPAPYPADSSTPPGQPNNNDDDSPKTHAEPK